MERFIKWNNVMKEFGPQDVIGFGDADGKDRLFYLP